MSSGHAPSFTPSLEGDDDAVLPFAVEAMDLRGRAVRLGTGGGEISGTAAGLDPDGALRIVGEDGSERRLTGGEETGVDGAG